MINSNDGKVFLSINASSYLKLGIALFFLGLNPDKIALRACIINFLHPDSLVLLIKSTIGSRFSS